MRYVQQYGIPMKNIFIIVIFTASSIGYSQSWQPTSLTGMQIWDIFIAKDNTIYASTNYYKNSFKVFRSKDKGLHWDTIYSVPNGIPSPLIKTIFADTVGNIFIGGSHGFYASSDGGVKWNSVNDFPGSVGTVFPEELIGMPNGNIIMGTHERIYYSTNHGASWDSSKSTYDHHEGFAMNSSQELFSGSFLGKVYKSTDSGINWTHLSTMPLKNGISQVQIYSLAISRSDSIYTASWFDGIYRSGDNGKTWSLISSTINPTEIISLRDGSIAALYNGKVYRTTNDGVTWDSVGSSFPAECLSIAVDKEGYMYVGTNGLYKSQSPITTVAEHELPPSTFTLRQNYPNPFNPSTVIGYQLPVNSVVTLKVFDLLGREVATLVDEGKPAGNYTVQFSGKHLASGVYFYRMQADNFIETKKLLLQK